MTLFSRFRTAGQEDFLTARLLKMFGFGDAAVYIYALVSGVFSRNTRTGFRERVQFVRSELDEASRGCAYARAFAGWLAPRGSWYRGAMLERAEYPVDGPQGPQRVLLESVVPLMDADAATAVRLRCQVVKYVFDDMVALSAGQGDPDCLFNVDAYMQAMAPDYREVRNRISGLFLRAYGSLCREDRNERVR